MRLCVVQKCQNLPGLVNLWYSNVLYAHTHTYTHIQTTVFSDSLQTTVSVLRCSPEDEMSTWFVFSSFFLPVFSGPCGLAVVQCVDCCQSGLGSPCPSIGRLGVFWTGLSVPPQTLEQLKVNTLETAHLFGTAGDAWFCSEQHIFTAQPRAAVTNGPQRPVHSYCYFYYCSP